MTTFDGPSPQAPEPEIAWERLHPLSVWATTIVVGFFLVPSAIVGAVVLAVANPSPWVLVPVPASLAFLALMTYLDLLRLRATRFRVTGERMEVRSGIIAKSYRSIPRERVRSVDVAAPIFVRIFGLCSVTVGTGEKVGSGGSDQLQLLYVTADQGEALRRDLLDRGRAAGSTVPAGAREARGNRSVRERPGPARSSSPDSSPRGWVSPRRPPPHWGSASAPSPPSWASTPRPRVGPGTGCRAGWGCPHRTRCPRT
nr:PH domain-containing protein [Nocardiopsis sp. CNR-923]